MKLFLNTEDYAVSGEQFQLFYDHETDMLVTKPQPNNLDQYYNSVDYISHTDANKSVFDKLYQNIKRISIRNKLALIANKKATQKNLLDVGAGTGDFLLAAKKRSWNVFGVEPNSTARIRAEEKGITLLKSLEELPEIKFNVITLWHVLEHLPDLNQVIQKLYTLLEPNGKLLIAVPNYKSYDARYYKNFWAAYDVSRHLWHFSRNTIAKLFAPQQMKIVSINPMYFDAFYVALLSEKYKKSSFQTFKAFWVGLFSNICAFKTKEYSSLIYHLEKE